VAIIGTLGILAFRIFLQTLGSALGIFGGIANAIFIGVGNGLYRKLAIRLTDWENHRTDTDYSDALIAKTFVFQFVNSYISLYYIAFVKDAKPSLFGVEEEGCKLGGCIAELAMQLGSIFVTQIVIGNLKEVCAICLRGGGGGVACVC